MILLIQIGKVYTRSNVGGQIVRSRDERPRVPRRSGPDPRYYNALLIRDSRTKTIRTAKYRIPYLYKPKFTKTVWVILTVAHPKAYDSSILRLRLTTWYFTTREIYLVLVLFRSNLFFISAFWANFRLRIRANFGWSFSHFRWINFLEST